MKSVDLTQGDIPKHLVNLALPMIIGIIANMSFNLVDTFFIGKLGIEQLTAISFSFPVIIIILNLSIGAAIGINSVLSRMIGVEQDKKIKSFSSLLIIIMAFISLLIIIAGQNSIEPLFRLLGAQKKHLTFIDDYMFYAYIAMGFRMVSISISGTFRAHGITKIPSFAIVCTAVINLILDPILIFGVDGLVEPMGIKGAGIATMISNFFALTIEFSFCFFIYKFLGNPLYKVKEQVLKLKEVSHISLVSAFGNALNPISVSIANYFLSRYQVQAVAGFGVASKIQAFSMIPILGLSAGVGPIIGQNYGRQRIDRIKSTLKYIVLFAFVWALVQSLGLTFFSNAFGQFFTNNKAALNFSSNYLFIISFSLIGYSLVILSSAVLNALNHPWYSFVSIGLRTIILFLIFVYILKYFGVVNYIIWAFFSANIFAGSISMLIIKSRLKELT